LTPCGRRWRRWRRLYRRRQVNVRRWRH